MGKTVIEETPKFSVSIINNLQKLGVVFNSDEDVLFIKPEKPIPAVSYDWKGEIWIRYEPVSKEIVGLEIENFESVFLKKYPEIAKVWKIVKPACSQKKTRVKTEDNMYESFIRIILSFLVDLSDNNIQHNISRVV